MLNTFSLSPYLIAYVCFVIQSFIMLSYVWFPKNYNLPEKGFWRYLLSFFKNFFFAFYYGLGIIIVDTSIMWLSGQWIYLDWRYQLLPVILGIVLGIQYIIIPMWTKPTKLDLIYAIGIIVILLYLIHDFMYDFNNAKENLTVFIIICIGLVLLYPILKFIEDIFLKKEKSNKLWDISEKMYKLFNRPFNIIFWIIATIEGILKFMGSSIFYIF